MTLTAVDSRFAVCLGYAASGVGAEAAALRGTLQSIITRQEEAVSIGQSRRELRTELIEVFHEQSHEQAHMSLDVYCKAEAFLLALPTFLPRPQVSADPDGDFNFEWRHGPRHGFTLSVGPTGELHYAGIFGLAKVRGTEVFSCEIPQTVLEGIIRVFKG